MSKIGEHIRQMESGEKDEKQPLTARRLGEEILRACEMAEKLNVPVILDTPEGRRVIWPDGSWEFIPKKRLHR